MGGQTALNVAMELVANGVLEKHGVELIGAVGVQSPSKTASCLARRWSGWD